MGRWFHILSDSICESAVTFSGYANVNCLDATPLTVTDKLLARRFGLLAARKNVERAVPSALPLGPSHRLRDKPIHLHHLSLITRHFEQSLRQIQRGDVDLIDVAESVARSVQLLQKFFVAQAFLQRLVGKAAVAGEEKPFAVRRNFRREIPGR